MSTADAAAPPDEPAIPILPAATVLMVRDAPGGDGPEVCLLRRNAGSAFVGGAYLFPGGAVDALDGTEAMAVLCEGVPDELAGAPSQGSVTAAPAVHMAALAHWVAALREAFEESGLLPAVDAATGAPLRFDAGPVAARFARHRVEIATGERTLAEVLITEGARLDLRGMHPIAHWVTPAGAPRRYDTHFFIAPAPEHQPLRQDGTEVVDACWIRPAEALERHEAGDFAMLPPTVESLRWLGGHPSAGAAIEAAAAITEIPRIVPRVLTGLDGSRRIVLPSDPGYDEAYDGASAIPRWRG